MGLPITPRAARRPLAFALAVGVALVLALGAPTPSAAASPAADPPAAAEEAPEVTWGVRPAPAPDGAPRDNYEYLVAPGEEVQDAIVVANYDDVPLVLDVYATDAFTTSSGQLDADTRDAAPHAVGAWVLPVADRITVQPGESLVVPFTLAVPGNATPGDHAGAILTSLSTPHVEEGVSVDRRLGIRIHLRVEGDIAPAAAVEDLRVSYAGTPNPFGVGEASVSYTVRNTGNTRLSAEQAIIAAGPFGWFAVGAAKVTAVPELLPGETWPVTVHLTGVVPAFVLTANVTLDPEAPVGTGAAPGPVEASASTAAVPWALLVLVLVVAGAVVLAVLRARRRRALQREREDARVQAAVEQALRERDGAAVLPPGTRETADAEEAGAPAGGQKTKT